MQKKKHPKIKARLHPQNRHRSRYDFKQLTESCPELTPFVAPNKYGDESIDFANPAAVMILNKALLKHHYGVENWEVPPRYLCPPVPGRADYIHHIADVLRGFNFGQVPTGNKVICLDIGVGASCIYPIIGITEYGWSFMGSDIDPVSIKSSQKIIDRNPFLKKQVELRLQENKRDVIYGVLEREERIDLIICNPPFHGSLAEAQAGTLRKLNNLNKKKTTEATLNFGGQNAELWCEGGEKRFIKEMIRESKKYTASCLLFSTLVSKQSHLKGIYEDLEKAEAVEVKTIPMGQGNKTSRIVAWTFLSKEEQVAWRENRWRVKKETTAE